MTVTPTLADATASIMVNGTAVASGSASQAINLSVGNNTITVVVTAQDGSTTKTYTITVNRAGSGNADLSSLTVSQGTLTPVFAAGTMSYTDSVANSITSMTVTPTLADATGSITVNGTGSCQRFRFPGNHPERREQHHHRGRYRPGSHHHKDLHHYRKPSTPSTNADLSSLTVSQGTLTPVFAAGTTSYTDSVANIITSMTVTPTVADATSTVTVNGTTVASGSASQAIDLNVGNNTITVVVTAQDGTTTKTYTITVNRAGSSNADLSNLTVSQGSLTPAFASGTTSYSDSVANSITSMTVTPTLADATASIMVNGTPVASGAASTAINLNVWSNSITVVVTAQDGTTTKTYTITVNRAPSINANLSSLTVSQGTLTPAFTTGTTSYTDSVANSVTGMTVTPTLADATASITVNGTPVANGSALPGNQPERRKQHHHRGRYRTGRHHHKDLHHYRKPSAVQQYRPEQPYCEPGYADPCLCSRNDDLYGLRRQQRYQHDRDIRPSLMPPPS